MGNEIVEKLIDAKVKELEKSFDKCLGPERVEEWKQHFLGELKSFGDNLKEVFEVKMDSMGLLQIIEKGGIVHRRMVLQKEHMLMSPRPADILERLTHDNVLYKGNLLTGDCRVTIIMEPMGEAKKE